jgi:sigma-B regulation protein RsbU (phosphoserine phosphatase)
LLKSLSPLKSVPGLLLETVDQGGIHEVLKGQAGKPAVNRVAQFAIEGIPDVELRLSAPEGMAFEMAEMALRAVLDRLGVERREESLLDELGANWESLEALYEISTDVLRFGDVVSALKRLIDRFVSLQDGLRACLLIGRHGRLERLVSQLARSDSQEPDEGPSHYDWTDLGPVEAPVRESRATVITQSPNWAAIAGEIPWRTASMLAAAPLTSRRQKVIGLVMVWREDRRYVFDAPFSRLLEAIAFQASMLLESDRLNRAMRENERLAQEIEIASSIQQTLLTGRPPVGVPRIEIAAYSAASQQIDGDFHDFLRHGDAVDVVIGDVMGKGVAAALLGAATKSQFLRAIANLSLRGSTPSPVAIVRRAASRLSERLIAVERFVTLCYARFDPPRSTVEFVDCGHTGILLHRKLTGESMFLRGDDLPLGISMESKFEQRSAPIMTGDTFLLFSDGVTETRNTEGDLFGEERLIEAVETFCSLGPTILVQQIRKAADEFRGEAPQADDFSCVALRLGPKPDSEIPERSAAEFACGLGELQSVGTWLRNIAERAGVEPERLARLEMSCHEAFVNCVKYGSPGECTRPVYLEGAIFKTHLQIEIRHQGPAFDPLTIPPPSFDGSRDGGFGTFIIMRSADALEYRRDGDINVISFSQFSGSHQSWN